MVTESEVLAAKSKYQDLTEKFLLENGWICDGDPWRQWSKGDACLLTEEEAFFNEIAPKK